MPTYEFSCERCPTAQLHIDQAKASGEVPKDHEAVPVCFQEAMIAMSEAPPVGAKIPCPVAGCKGKLVRIVSVPEFIIKQRASQHWGTGGNNTIRTKVGDREIDFQFVDHPHTDPNYQNKLAQIAGLNGIKQTGLGSSYFSEKHGRHVVEVTSNVPDPLGMIERSKAAGNYNYTKIGVGQKYQTRKVKKKS